MIIHFTVVLSNKFQLFFPNNFLHRGWKVVHATPIGYVWYPTIALTCSSPLFTPIESTLTITLSYVDLFSFAMWPLWTYNLAMYLLPFCLSMCFCLNISTGIDNHTLKSCLWRQYLIFMTSNFLYFLFFDIQCFASVIVSGFDF